ncbi:polysaccharide biosynthesis/export family protein [Mucilaginibacter phyllosphaerae]|uniref:Polysaccharide export outer membrane protein n=1 Tax=Mucilaginibacter phyllosphaerae TaxID=1812349 RepID=A0ABR6I6N1_9SPHI|nr:polysaccharide biosynthesis/export family protein [Mucilaginibacter phyllosphaerae]MBB3968647.1 polysaccharide export outer membrane protein [Mucilaginibacter phyllosphaerae]
MLFSVLTVLSSCINQKKVVYFQKSANETDTIGVAKAYIPKIQPGDILTILVSSLNPAASSFFNPLLYSPPSTSIDNSGNASTTTTLPISQQSNGFLVDPNGIIQFPLLGAIKVVGLTSSEVRDTIRNKLQPYLKEATVNVRFLNYKISIMGEVMRPSVYVVPNERITLPEALSMAGDLTVFAKKDNILIVRDNNGKKEFGRVNLNTREVFNSPYYYLHSGDLIYVEQGKNKSAQTDMVYRILPIALSAISILVVFLTRK